MGNYASNTKKNIPIEEKNISVEQSKKKEQYGIKKSVLPEENNISVKQCESLESIKKIEQNRIKKILLKISNNNHNMYEYITQNIDSLHMEITCGGKLTNDNLRVYYDEKHEKSKLNLTVSIYRHQTINKKHIYRDDYYGHDETYYKKTNEITCIIKLSLNVIQNCVHFNDLNCFEIIGCNNEKNKYKIQLNDSCCSNFDIFTEILLNETEFDNYSGTIQINKHTNLMSIIGYEPSHDYVSGTFVLITDLLDESMDVTTKLIIKNMFSNEVCDLYKFMLDKHPENNKTNKRPSTISKIDNSITTSEQCTVDGLPVAEIVSN
jgi:hypothetical protein